MLPSLKVPVAANCNVVPGAIEGAGGVIAMDCKTALVTVTLALEEMLPEVAVTVEEPKPMAMASPAVPFALMPTIEGFADTHCTEAVTSCLLPSVKVPVADNCRVVPSGRDGAGGEIASDASAAAVTVNVVVPVTPE